MSFGLKISSDGRRIVNSDGTPFFWLADTAWELFHRLNREDTLLYLSDRAEKGFNVIQAVALAEFDGLGTPNAYGRVPLLRGESGGFDPTKPDLSGDYSYWAHIDFVVEEAANRGIYIAMLPTWGDKYNKCWGTGPEIFNAENAYAYGRFIAERYGKFDNIVWILGGDRTLDTRRHFEVICRMADGIRDIVGHRQLITFHPTGARSSSGQLHNEDWLDFNMIQSGHSRTFYNYKLVAADFTREPHKPVIDGEPSYENHPESFNPANGYLDAADVRQFMYMSILSGACGHTYGNHSIWSMANELPVKGFANGHFCMTWKNALSSIGSAQMQYGKQLWLSFDMTNAYPAPELIRDQLGGSLYMPVLKGENFLLVYTAMGLPIILKSGFAGGNRLSTKWYNPRTGEYSDISITDDSSDRRFDPPSSGRGNDWVLVINIINNKNISVLPNSIQQQIKSITDIIIKYVPSVCGVYLHGSICLGGYVDGRSDIDILIISDEKMDGVCRTAFADAILTVHDKPAHIELSVVTSSDIMKLPVVCQFHFSEMWAGRYAAHDQTNPLLGDFPDDDIPAYIHLTRQSGITLYGQPPQILLPEISDAQFFTSVTQEIDDFAFEAYGIFDSNILTLARTLSFAETRRELTKVGGAEWAIERLPRFAELLKKAIKAFVSCENGVYDAEELEEYRMFMINAIKAAKI